MHEYEGSEEPLLRQSFPKVYFTVQVTEGSLESLTRPSFEELDSSTSEELDWATSDEDDSGTASAEFGSAEELVCSKASDELSGSVPGLSSGAPVEESESLPQLAQKNPITDRQLKRINLRIFILPPFPIKIFFFSTR
jgi:hypothetical protein